jgi:hypothetical protein
VKGINVFEMEKEGMFAILPILAKIINMCEQTFNHTDVQKLIHSGDKFDVVIVELLMNDAHNILASHFNAPLVLFSTVGVNTWINQLVVEIHNPSLTYRMHFSDFPAKCHFSKDYLTL